MRQSVRFIFAALAFAGLPLLAQAQDALRLGVLTDMNSGFSAWSGKGSALAAQMAVEDYRTLAGASALPVEIIVADHQNKPDVGSAITREWLDKGVNAILDVPNSAVALAVNGLVRDSKAVFLTSGGSHDALTGKECSPNTVQWTFDLWSLTHGTVAAAMAHGDDSWFFVTADFAGGQGLERVATSFLQAAGGHAVGHTLPPPGTADYASFLLQAQASKAKVVSFAMAGQDLMNAIKQAGEFGIVGGGQRIVTLAVFLSDVHGLGLQAAQGLTYTTAFYWDVDAGKRDFARRFAARNDGNYPSQVHAGVYAATLHYLKSVAAAGTRDGKAVVLAMKKMPTDDALFGHASIRVDGRHMHDMYVVEVKKPAESTSSWDLLKVINTIPAEQAFRPASKADCALVP